MTPPSIRPLAVTDPDQLACLLEENLSALEPGLSLLDRRFPAGQVVVDLLGQDARGRLVLVMFGSGSEAALLLQALEAYGWCRENEALLRHLFPGARLDAATPPRLCLLAPRFADSLRRTARHLGSLAPTLVECRAVELNGERAVSFEPVEGRVEAAPPSAPVGSSPPQEPEAAPRARAQEFVRHLERLSFREAFR